MKYRYLIINEDYSVTATNDRSLVEDMLSHEVPVIDMENCTELEIDKEGNGIVESPIKEASYD